MADNYLEKQYALYEARKAEWLKGGKLNKKKKDPRKGSQTQRNITPHPEKP